MVEEAETAKGVWDTFESAFLAKSTTRRPQQLEQLSSLKLLAREPIASMQSMPDTSEWDPSQAPSMLLNCFLAYGCLAVPSARKQDSKVSQTSLAVSLTSFPDFVPVLHFEQSSDGTACGLVLHIINSPVVVKLVPWC